MRYNKRSLIARRNKVLPVRFIRQDTTTYAGLTLIDHYLKLCRINFRLKQTLKSYGFKGDYGIGNIFLFC